MLCWFLLDVTWSLLNNWQSFCKGQRNIIILDKWYILRWNLPYFMKCNLGGKHYLVVMKMLENFLENGRIHMVETSWKIDFLLTIYPFLHYLKSLPCWEIASNQIDSNIWVCHCFQNWFIISDVVILNVRCIKPPIVEMLVGVIFYCQNLMQRAVIIFLKNFQIKKHS